MRTPSPIAKLKEDMPAVYEQFQTIAHNLENHYRDMQDMEFTIENGKLYMLQTRNGKRTAAAALKIAVDLVDEGMITEEEAVLRVEPKQLDSLLHPMFDAKALKAAKPIGAGLAASPGAACGRWSLPLRTPPSGPKRATRSSSCVWRPLRRTSRAWFPRRAFSPCAAA